MKKEKSTPDSKKSTPDSREIEALTREKLDLTLRLRDACSDLEKANRKLAEVEQLRDAYASRLFAVEWGMVAALKELRSLQEQMRVQRNDMNSGWRALAEDKKPEYKHEFSVAFREDELKIAT